MTYSYDRVRTGQRIQARRMALELTQEQLAERMDCSLRFVADVERGAVGMSIDSLVRACAANSREKRPRMARRRFLAHFCYFPTACCTSAAISSAVSPSRRERSMTTRRPLSLP